MTKKDIAEFYAALAMLAKEKGIEVDYLLERISAAIVVAVKKDFGGDDNIIVNMDPATSDFSVVIRKEVVDDAYIASLYKEMTSMYRLDQTQVDGQWKKDFGPMPSTAVFLLTALVCVWVIIAIFAVANQMKVRKKRK